MPKRGRPRKRQHLFTVQDVAEYTSDSASDTNNIQQNVPVPAKYQQSDGKKRKVREEQQNDGNMQQIRAEQEEDPHQHMEEEHENNGNDGNMQQVRVEEDPHQYMEEDHEEEEQRQEVGSRPTTPLAMPQVRENEEVHLQNPPIFESDNEDEDEEEDDFLNGDVQDYDTILNDLKSQWLLTEAHHSVSKSASQAFWKLGLLYFTKLHTAPGRKKKTPLFKSIRNQMHKELLPPVSLEIGYKNLTSGEIVVVNDTVTPVKRFSPNNFEKLYEVASVEVSYIENYPNEHLK